MFRVELVKIHSLGNGKNLCGFPIMMQMMPRTFCVVEIGLDLSHNCRKGARKQT